MSPITRLRHVVWQWSMETPAEPEHRTIWTIFDPLFLSRRELTAPNTHGRTVTGITDPGAGSRQSCRRGNLAGGNGQAVSVHSMDQAATTFRYFDQETVVQVVVTAGQALERSPTKVRPPRGGGIEHVLWGDNRK